MARVCQIFADINEEHIKKFIRILESKKLDSPEELHELSRSLMDEQKLLKALTITVARDYLYKNVTHIVAFEKWTASPIAFIVADFLTQLDKAPKTRAVVRRKPETPSFEILIKPERFKDPLPVYLPKNAFGVGDEVIIVDDFVGSGDTLLKLKFLAEQTGAKVLGALIFAARSSGYKRIINGFFDEISGRLLRGFNKEEIKLIAVFE
jgi:adenine/guanine phosphoribosyltransferase-like PRPP-binding protein